MERARNQANKILNELRINSLPVDSYEIADKLNCKIMKILPNELPKEISRDPNSFSGALIRDFNNSNYILVNKTHSSRRQNFTIAHELGHLILHNSSRIDYRDGMFNDTIEEQQANEFAGSLLMPSSWLKTIIDEVTDDNQELANIFDVSLQAMQTRRGKLKI